MHYTAYPLNHFAYPEPQFGNRWSTAGVTNLFETESYFKEFFSIYRSTCCGSLVLPPICLPICQRRRKQRGKRVIANCCVLAFTETWLDPVVPDSAITPAGFSIYRQDRTSELAQSTSSADNSGDPEALNKSRCDLQRAIRDGKRDYRDKLESN
ncbi:unnamed protein product [Pleuronectes platessa]|uniref:Uncharacterized protein n=1 Tax=Pleuronectes platessa TaxID=8262 RepID=A0A9N7VRI1_PLEPL|nr:unnamed protein product [Pleuronectes platessa]